MSRIKGWTKTEDDPEQMVWVQRDGNGEIVIFRDADGFAEISGPGINRLVSSMTIARRIALNYMRSHPNG
jgi:hypothetical protein